MLFRSTSTGPVKVSDRLGLGEGSCEGSADEEGAGVAERVAYSDAVGRTPTEVTLASSSASQRIAPRVTMTATRMARLAQKTAAENARDFTAE